MSAPSPSAGSEAPASTHYDFELLGERESSFFLQKGIKESLRQWGMEDSLRLTQIHFSPSFMPHEETIFLRQLLAFAADKTITSNANMDSFSSVQSMRWEALKCTATSMDLFNCLFERGIVSQSGNIRGCFPDVFEGVSVSDTLRELLVNPDSENADVFSADQQQELLFHVFRALSVGGGVCQPDDNLEPYTTAAKALYKDLVSVQKNTSTGKLEIAACKAYRVSEIFSGDDDNESNFSSSWNKKGSSSSGLSASPHSAWLVVVDTKKKRASVLRKEFVPFW